MLLIVIFFTLIFRIFQVLISYGYNWVDFDLRLKTAFVSYVGFIALCKASKSSIAATIEISIKSKNPHFWLPNIFFEFEFLWMSTISLFILGQLLFRENNYSKWEIFVARDPTGFYLHLTQLHPYNLYNIFYCI